MTKTKDKIISIQHKKSESSISYPSVKDAEAGERGVYENSVARIEPNNSPSSAEIIKKSKCVIL